jgi:hypothetical protein
MNAVRGKADEDAQITDRPNNIAKGSLHKASRETAEVLKTARAT